MTLMTAKHLACFLCKIEINVGYADVYRGISYSKKKTVLHFDFADPSLDMFTNVVEVIALFLPSFKTKVN